MVSYYTIILYGSIAYKNVDILKEIEMQSGFLRLLVYLNKNGEKQITDIMEETGIPVHQVYRSLEKAKSLGLVKSRIDDTKYPHRNLISLTEKGEKLSSKVREMILILEKTN
jgi:DNA-binding MarR family transcriptional regulator